MKGTREIGSMRDRDVGTRSTPALSLDQKEQSTFVECQCKEHELNSKRKWRGQQKAQ